MGLFDSIRNAVGGSDDGSEDDEMTLLDSTTLDPTDFRERAERVAAADGLDFSLASLDQLDTLVATLDEPVTADDATAATTYTEQTVDFGSYLGEVLVRVYDGDWVREEGWGVTVAGPDDEVTVSVFEVAVRSLESNPVFAAVVERLQAELALDALDTDAPTTPDDTEPEADATTERSEDSDAPSASSDDGTEEDAGDVADSPADLIAEAEPSAEDADSRETGEDADSGPEPDDVDTEEVDEETLDLANGTPESSGTGPEDAAGTDASSMPDTERLEDEADDRPADTPQQPPDLSVSDDAEGPAEQEPDSEIEHAPDSTSDTDTESSNPVAAEESGASSDGSAAETDEAAAGATDEAATVDDEGLVDEQPLTEEASPTDEATETVEQAPDDERPSGETATEEPVADPETDPAAGDGLRAEYAETAQEFIEFWSERDLDYSPGSLARLDDLVDGEWEANRFRNATFGSEDDFDDRAFTSIVTELGSYFGEVLVRDLDGEWTDETDHVGAVIVPTDAGPLAVPVFQVAMNSLRQTAVFERSYDALLEDIGH